ncbi:uncharacterized protein LOC113583957 [Electrophorus electricus]|uniref:uncharacterized protein LOC113583957 n=1 Tax=Electrophorus electricus TaxID=8005 RepID=UPI0015D08DF7|nr:uncharacterized protein LOC113583957 [Electrophorus electricus]
MDWKSVLYMFGEKEKKKNFPYHMILIVIGLIGSEKIVENDFECPCREDFREIIFWFYLIIPGITAFTITFYIVSKSHGSKKTREEERQEKCRKLQEGRVEKQDEGQERQEECQNLQEGHIERQDEGQERQEECQNLQEGCIEREDEGQERQEECQNLQEGCIEREDEGQERQEECQNLQEGCVERRDESQEGQEERHQCKDRCYVHWAMTFGTSVFISLLWVVLFFTDGRYVECRYGKLNENYAYSSEKVCSYYISISKILGFSLMLILSVLALALKCCHPCLHSCCLKRCQNKCLTCCSVCCDEFCDESCKEFYTEC